MQIAGPVVENNKCGDAREDNCEQSSHQCTRAPGGKHMIMMLAKEMMDDNDLISMGWLGRERFGEADTGKLQFAPDHYNDHDHYHDDHYHYHYHYDHYHYHFHSDDDDYDGNDVIVLMGVLGIRIPRSGGALSSSQEF